MRSAETWLEPGDGHYDSLGIDTDYMTACPADCATQDIIDLYNRETHMNTISNEDRLQ